jgi:CRP/FNR family transcriptional regulator
MGSLIKPPSCQECEVRGECLFSNLENCHLEKISDAKNINYYKKGSVIFHENNYPLGLYGIYKGKAKLYKTSEMGKEHILKLAKEGDTLGYRALISSEKYEVSAMAIEDCHVCFVPKNLFLETLKVSPKLTDKVMELLTGDLRVAEEKISDLAQKTVKERVAETILLLKDFYGLEEDEKTISVNLSREDLANLVGTATETLIRSLSEFKKNQVIELKGKKIVIQNMSLLNKIANSY